MRRQILSGLLCAALVLSPFSAIAQIQPGGGMPVTPAGQSATQAGAIQGVTGGVPVPVTGTFTATLGGFTPAASGARMTPLSVTTSDSTVTLPTGGAVAVISNVGTTNPMYCNVNGVAATTSDQLIGANSWFAFTKPSGATALHCIATGGSTTANGVGGDGLPTGAGGGGVGGSSGATASFQASASTPYLNIPSVTNVSSTQNFALPTGTNVVLWNYGGYKIAYQMSTSGSSGVTVATADGFIQPGCTAAVAVGSNTNISVGTTAAGLTSSMQVVGGSGLWTGASCANLSLGQAGLTAPSFVTMLGGIDNSSLAQKLGATAAGTSSTGDALAVQGITGGIPVPVSGGASQATNSVPINISTATTTQLVALSAGKVIQITSFNIIAGGTGNITLEWGTSANCAAGATPITGAYNLTAQAGVAIGSGLGPILFVPAGDALCALTSAGVQMSGSVSYLQF